MGALLAEGEGAEDVEAVEGGTNDDSGDLRVPVHFLDLLLTLMHKQELRGHVLEPLALALVLREERLVLVQLDGEVPQRHLVVCSSGGERRRFCRVPFDRGDGRGVPVERRDWRRSG
jgi:hypothetical protein